MGQTWDEFWGEMEGVYSVPDAVDRHIQGKSLDGPSTTALRELTDAGREAAALPLPQPAGVRVRFTSNVGSFLTYDDPPEGDAEGTVILVKTGAGKATSLDGNVFVLWDDGKFRSIRAEHLRLASTAKRTAGNFRRVVSYLGDLSDFFRVAGQADELVHKATQDLWALKKDGGNFVIERLFNEDGKPLKV